MRKLIVAAYTGVSLLCLATPAFAQNAPDGGAENPANKGDIVVTGTLIRGIAPGGSQSIDVSKEKITSIGAANTSDLVAAIPQTGNFNAFVGVRGSSGVSLSVNRPVLRYLGFTSSATASTLLLVDGHRLPGMGITQNSADLDAIPAGAIERVEVVTDGGSSTYGSDAVGGAINFITRKEFDGVEAKAQYGIASDIQQVDASITAGKKWDGGSIYISYD
jgi:iron complex outermembrane recepter protein